MSEIQQVLRGLQQVLKQHNGNAGSTGIQDAGINLSR
jgi:hypothetical protein